MAENLSVPEDLARHFAAFREVAGESDRILGDLAHLINLTNASAGGEDETAKTIRKTIGPAADQMHTLVAGIGDSVDKTAGDGSAVSRNFDNADHSASKIAKTFRAP